ncbi:MAG: M20/M25/M40 family metallo-hydrolase [Candidatus Hodarchaeales archaeon]|jgi:acetylornithine deacetylase/succinyl-diaminopimelate desuccinylase-like protein
MNDTIKDFLTQLIAFQSVSSDKSKVEESKKTAEFIVTHLEKIGVETELITNEATDKNPFVFGKIGSDSNKKTLLFYSHYDVQPAFLEDGWDSDPFILIEKDDGYLYGRGVSDDKGPITATYFAVKELLEEGELPVNIRFLYEGEEESSSGGFKKTVTKHKDFFGEIDGILILDGAWFDDNRPSMEYGFRGITYMGIEISGPSNDLHSGLVGGVIREPMTDLISLMSKLITLDGKVLVDGFYDKVLPLTEEERKLYNNLQFSLDDYKQSLGMDKVLAEDPTQTLMNMWRNPALTLHGIQGAFSGSGSKTVVPSTVIGKVSMRLVPDQDPHEIENLFTQYITKEFEKLNSPNRIRIISLGLGDWWYGDVSNFLFKSGEVAIKEYWKMDAAYARSGGSIPIIPFIEKIFSAPAMGLGIGQSSDGAHSQNEKIRIKNLIGGKKVIKLIMKHVSTIFSEA